MSKHTPGPWVIDWNMSRLDIFSADATTLVSTLRRSALSSKMDETAKANARLIAAAPDLLEALRNADKLITQLMPGVRHIALQDYGFLNDTLMANTAAIAKATGVIHG